MTERKNQEALRYETWRRDQGVCALCTVDTIALFERFYPTLPTFIDQITLMPRDDETCLIIIEGLRDRFVAACDIISERIRQRGKRRLRYPWIREAHTAADCWQADHIIPLSEGGTNELSNMRTLCLGCHRGVTKDLKKRLARRPVKKGVRI